MTSLTHWGRVTHICVSKLTIIGADNGLSPGRHQAIIWTNAGILLIRTSGTNFSEISSEIHTFSFKKIHSKMSSAKWHPFYLGLNELIQWQMANRVVSVVLLAVTLTVCCANSQCKTTETCQLENTRGTSTASSIIPRSSIYPASCPAVCSLNAECIATTFDPTTENCELHEAYVDGAPCITLSTDVGSTFWMMKESELPCPKVRL